MQVIRNHKQTGAEIASKLAPLQRAKSPPLALFTGNDDETGEARKISYEIDTIRPGTPEGKKRWNFLHNSPSIKVVAEKDYMSHRDGLTTVIRFMRFVDDETKDELMEDLLPE